MRLLAFLLLLLPAFTGPALAQSLPAGQSLALELPECVSFKNGRLDCLARDKNGQFVWMYHDGRRWSAARLLPERFAGPASCVVRGPFGLNCFAMRADGSLWHIAMNGGRWRNWLPLGGRLALGRPSCLAPARNQIQCFARTRSSGLAVKAWNGDTIWQEWRDLGGRLSGDPTCVRLSFERSACFWRRDDGLLSGYFPVDAGPGGAILSLPRMTGRPSCAPLSGDRAVCLALLAGGSLQEWRGDAVLGGVGLDGLSVRPANAARDPFCFARADRTICSYVAAGGQLTIVEATPQGWTAPVVVAQAAAFGRCALFDPGRLACPFVGQDGVLRIAFREDAGSAGSGVAIAALPVIAEKPPVPTPPPALLPVPPPAALPVPPPAALPVPPPAQPPLAPAIVSMREPLGAWRVFEPRTGLHCQITLFDAPARPYRSLTLDRDCGALASMRGVARWSGEDDGIHLRDARGRVFFRFFEAGPTALRARWRRSDFIMMARDLRAFTGQPPATAAKPDQPVLPPVPPPATAPTAGVVGVWRLREPGRRPCVVRLTIDPDTAQTRARPENCSGAFDGIDSWSVRNGALVLERNGTPFARFVEGRGVAWRGRFENKRRGGLVMIKQ